LIAEMPLRATGTRARRRAIVDAVMHVVLGMAVISAIVPLVLIVAVTIAQGLPAMSLEFLTSTFNFSRRVQGGGYLHGLIGTLYMGGLATLMSVPTGIGAALFLTEFPRSRLAAPIRFFADVMTGVPSVFVGLFVYVLLVRQIGFGTFVGAVALAIIMLPIIVRSAEEILRTVPGEQHAGGILLRLLEAAGCGCGRIGARALRPEAGRAEEERGEERRCDSRNQLCRMRQLHISP